MVSDRVFGGRVWGHRSPAAFLKQNFIYLKLERIHSNLHILHKFEQNSMKFKLNPNLQVLAAARGVVVLVEVVHVIDEDLLLDALVALGSPRGRRCW
jgi:hypothetical protein